MKQLAQCHGQRVVAAGRAARAHAQAHADADKQRAHDGREQWHAGQLRPQRRELLKDRVEQGEAAARNGGIEDEQRTERLQPEEITRRVEHQA